MSDFAKNLRQFRKEKGYTQIELAKLINYGYTAIANYESARNEPSLDTLIELARILDVTTDELVGSHPLTDENQILARFKRLSAENQRIVSELINALL
ncbi:helix-turn-helix domain-containing protein [Anaerotignum sp.]